MSDTTLITITHRETGTVLAQGPRGWGITPFEGNYYVQGQYLKGEYFKNSPIPGLCFYKGLYHWLTIELPGGHNEAMAAWRYVVPNPLFPFIAFRAGLCGRHPALEISRERMGSEETVGLE